MRPGSLFSGVSIFDVVENQKRTVQKAVQELDSNYLLNASEGDLVAALTEEFRLRVPVLKEDAIYVAEASETQVDVRGDPTRLIIDARRPVYVPGSRTVIAIPFDGDPNFFGIQPSTWTSITPASSVEESEIRLVYTRTDHDADSIKRQYREAVGQIKQYLGWLENSANDFNGRLEAFVRQNVEVRKRRLLADAGMVAALGLPIRRREDAPLTYSVPVQRQRLRIERPPATTHAFAPEPILAEEEYANILSIIRNMALVIERSPQAFQGMKEEDLRMQFLVQLNGQYEGQATGETFNFQGKTDILIRADNRNVFIAECKFWTGKRGLLEAIEQLLSYASWRDTKTAIVIFNRNRNFTDVLGKIAAAVPKHPCFKRDLGRKDETTFRYVLHQPDDRNREIILSILAFDVPAESTGSS